MNILKSIADTFKKIFLDKTNKYKIISRETLKETIDESLSLNRNLLEILGSMTKQDIELIYKNYKSNYKDYKNVKDYYEMYLKSLGAKAKTLETKKIGNSFITAANYNISILVSIQKNFDNIFEKDIQFVDLSVTEAAIVGCVHNTDFIMEWAYQFFILFISISNKENIEMPVYRTAYLETNIKHVSEVMNSIIDTNGYSNLIKDIDKLKKESKNTNYFVQSKRNNFALDSLHQDLMMVLKSSDEAISSTIRFLSYGVLPIIKLFMWAPSKIEGWKYQKYQEHKQLVTYLQTVIARNEQLKFNLAIDDPEYQRLQKIIESYDEMLIDTQKKIYDYEQQGE